MSFPAYCASKPEEYTVAPPSSNRTTIVAAAGVLIAAMLLAWCIHILQAGRSAEQAVLLTGILFAGILSSVPAACILNAAHRRQPATVGLSFLATCAVLLLAVYFFWVSWYVFFPADFLTWSEGDFVNDILKFSLHYPLFSPQINNDSFTYVPGSQVLTYLLASLVGKGDSIVAFRFIQLIYSAAAAFLAVLCCRRILSLAWPDAQAPHSRLWNVFWYAALLLVATNSVTNPFSHNLHGDALAQLVAVSSYYLLLEYGRTRKRGVLAALGVLVPVGFLVRQSLLPWAGLYAGVMALWDQSWKRLAIYLAAVALLAGLTVGLCYAIWGGPFFYWTIEVLRAHPVSPLRSFQHALTAWPYFAAGLLGGAAVLRGKNSKMLLGAWLVWLAVLTVEAYSSGIAWMLNHMGPGSLLAGVWFFAGLASVWDRAIDSRARDRRESWIRAGALTVSATLFFSGLGVVRIPVQAVPADAYRYVSDIEHAFNGQPANRVLLDAGTWIYFRERVVMGDRAPSIGERGLTGIGDFSGILSRIASHRYSKILVRGFHAPDFVYDYYLWPKSSGIRQALIDNYRETGTIRAAQANPYAQNWAEDPYYFGEITILEPKMVPQGHP